MADGVFQMVVSGQMREVGDWIPGRGQVSKPMPGMRIGISGSPGEQFESEIKYSTTSLASPDSEKAGRFELRKNISGSETMVYVYSMVQGYSIVDFAMRLTASDYRSATPISDEPSFVGEFSKTFDVRVMKTVKAERIRRGCRFATKELTQYLMDMHEQGGVVSIHGNEFRSYPQDYVRDCKSDCGIKFLDPSLLIHRRLRAIENKEDYLRSQEQLRLDSDSASVEMKMHYLNRNLEKAATVREKLAAMKRIDEFYDELNGDSTM